jgi:hypothetical protein
MVPGVTFEVCGPRQSPMVVSFTVKWSTQTERAMHERMRQMKLPTKKAIATKIAALAIGAIGMGMIAPSPASAKPSSSQFTPSKPSVPRLTSNTANYKFCATVVDTWAPELLGFYLIYPDTHFPYVAGQVGDRSATPVSTLFSPSGMGGVNISIFRSEVWMWLSVMYVDPTTGSIGQVTFPILVSLTGTTQLALPLVIDELGDLHTIDVTIQPFAC